MQTFPTFIPPPPNEADIRAYVYKLCRRGGRIAGRYLNDWLDAEEGHGAHIPPRSGHLQLCEYPLMIAERPAAVVKIPAVDQWIQSHETSDHAEFRD